MESKKTISITNITTLVKPILIQQIDIFRDGGTIGLHLTGDAGREFLCAVDNAIGSSTPNRLFVGDFYPSSGAKFIEQGSQEETEILQVLQEIIDREYSRDEQNLLKDAYGTQVLNEGQRKTALCLAAIINVRSDWAE